MQPDKSGNYTFFSLCPAPIVLEQAKAPINGHATETPYTFIIVARRFIGNNHLTFERLYRVNEKSP